MFAYIDTEVDWLKSTSKIPWIGFWLILIYSICPVILVVPLGTLSGAIFGPAIDKLSPKIFEIIIMLLALMIIVAWNRFLWSRDIRIYIFFVPADIFWTILLVALQLEDYFI